MPCNCTPTLIEFPSTFVRGDTVRFAVCFKDGETPLDIRGWELWLILRDRLLAAFEDVFKVRYVTADDVTAQTGTAVLTVHSEDTARLLPGKYFFELKRVLPNTQPPDIWTFAFDTKPTVVVHGGTVLFEAPATSIAPYQRPQQGAAGPQGPPGPAGASAYETWLSLGNVGTEQDFLDALGSGGSSPERLVALDVETTQWYCRYPSRIVRIDHSTAPPARTQYIGQITDELWVSRETLTYV